MKLFSLQQVCSPSQDLGLGSIINKERQWTNIAGLAFQENEHAREAWRRGDDDHHRDSTIFDCSTAWSVSSSVFLVRGNGRGCELIMPAIFARGKCNTKGEGRFVRISLAPNVIQHVVFLYVRRKVEEWVHNLSPLNQMLPWWSGRRVWNPSKDRIL